MKTRIRSAVKRWFCRHLEFAEIVHFTNGSTIAIKCFKCERTLHCFIRIPIVQHVGVIPASFQEADK